MVKHDLNWWKFVFDLIQLAFTVGIAIYVWILSKHKANATRISKLEGNTDDRLQELDLRMTKQETMLNMLPDKTAISNTHKRLDEHSKVLHHVEGQLKGLNDNTAMILKALLENNKGDK